MPTNEKFQCDILSHFQTLWTCWLNFKALYYWVHFQICGLCTWFFGQETGNISLPSTRPITSWGGSIKETEVSGLTCQCKMIPQQNCSQDFLNDGQYQRNGILRYERVFGKTYVSTGGETTTKVFQIFLKVGFFLFFSFFSIFVLYGWWRGTTLHRTARCRRATPSSIITKQKSISM